MVLSSYDHLLNPKLIEMARERVKLAFIPAGDPSQGGMGAPPAGGDPSGGMGGGGGGAPPPGGDPSGGMGGGGAPPPTDPSGGGGSPLDKILQKLNQITAPGGPGGMAGGAPGSGAALKPKIDVNVELMQIKNMLAKICDHLQIHIPAQDMTATPDKLMAMSQGQSTAAPQPGGAGGAGGGGGGAIGGMDPMGGMQPAGQPAQPGATKMGRHNNGTAFDHKTSDLDTRQISSLNDFATALGSVLGKS